MIAAKAWAALASLIVTALLGTETIPVTGTVHTVLTILAVIVGAFLTWATPNKDATPPTSTIYTP